MKLNALRRRAFLEDAAQARLQPSEPRDYRIEQAIKSVVPKGQSYVVLSDTPEQLEDRLRVLVDDHTVVSLSLPRSTGEAYEIEVRDVVEHLREIGQGLERMKVEAAIDLARDELGPPE